MLNFDRILGKLLKGELELLSLEERELLEQNLESKDLEEYQSLLAEINQADQILEPANKSKLELLRIFREKHQLDLTGNKKGSFSLNKPYFRNIAATIVVLLGVGMLLYVAKNNRKTNPNLPIEEEEFYQFTQVDQAELKEDSIASETKFLMTMDFFSNRSISLDYD